MVHLVGETADVAATTTTNEATESANKGSSLNYVLSYDPMEWYDCRCWSR